MHLSPRSLLVYHCYLGEEGSKRLYREANLTSLLMASKKEKPNPSAPSDDLYHKFLEFVKSPMWVLPVMSFVEQRSVVFDKDQGDEKLYKPIHNEFRNLVDMLIQCFCDDLGVKPQQVAQTLKHDQTQPPRSKLEWTCLEPVLAASDYNLFIHMMMRKNIELQLQALQMIEIMCGLIPAVLLPGGRGDQGPKDKEDQEKLILVQVMRQSKDDYEKEKRKMSEGNDALDKALKESLAEKERLEHEKRREERLIQEALKLSLNDSESKDSRSASAVGQRKGSVIPPKESKKDLPAVKSRAMSIGEAPPIPTLRSSKEETWDASKSGPPSRSEIKLKDKSDKVSEESLAKRQEYLKQQRDKLLAMKREARERAFADAESEGGRTRPKTAKAAKSALRGRGHIGGEATDDVMAARRALVEKLKQEVVGNQ